MRLAGAIFANQNAFPANFPKKPAKNRANSKGDSYLFKAFFSGIISSCSVSYLSCLQLLYIIKPRKDGVIYERNKISLILKSLSDDKQMIIECQNNNVTACRFYKKQGALLSKIDMHAYDSEPEIENEVQFIWYLDL